jgi:hypothetical protein
LSEKDPEGLKITQRGPYGRPVSGIGAPVRFFS